MRSIRATSSVLVFLLSGTAAAGWTPLGVEDEIHAAYFDRDTLHRTGATAHMSGLYDFRRQDFTPAGKALYSTVVLREYDCAARRVRLLSYIDFAGHMGTGEVVDRMSSSGRWETVMPGAVDEAYWKVACATRP
jgi:hypothetical protein